MTNLEKAREIASEVIVEYGPDYIDVAEKAALEMAEWKDSHLKDAIQKIIAVDNWEKFLSFIKEDLKMTIFK